MRTPGGPLQQCFLALALAAGGACFGVHAAEVTAVQVDSGASGTRAELRLDSQARFEVIYLANPDRLVLDLPGSAIGKGLRLPAGAGIVKSVRTGQPVPGTARVVFDLAAPVSALSPRLEQAADGPRLVLEWPADGPQPAPASTAVVSAPASLPAVASPSAATTVEPAAGAPVAATSQPIAAAASTAQVLSPPSEPARVPATQPTTAATTAAAPPPAQDATAPPVKTMQDVIRRAGLRPLVIAIDAGHGGQDSGAIGATGAREKDITLQVARELARQVNATPGLKAYLTRDADFFIPLAQRYQKARAAKADLFVSIHADAFTNPAARGSSVFVLSQRGASSQAAKWLAGQENAADLVGGVRLQDKDDTLASVLLDLSQSATMKASEDMANHVLDGLKALGKTHKPHVERANFVVLRSPDVPSMLVETAFITNPEEERRLRDPEHQRRLATAILNGVNRYFTRQPPPGTLYAARANSLSIADAGGSP